MLVPSLPAKTNEKQTILLNTTLATSPWVQAFLLRKTASPAVGLGNDATLIFFIVYLIMAKIDEVKEILNTLRIVLSIVAGIIVILIGKLFTKFEDEQFDIVFWIVSVVTLLVILVEAIVVFNISKKTKEIKDL